MTISMQKSLIGAALAAALAATPMLASASYTGTAVGAGIVPILNTATLATSSQDGVQVLARSSQRGGNYGGARTVRTTPTNVNSNVRGGARGGSYGGARSTRVTPQNVNSNARGSSQRLGPRTVRNRYVR
jgi:hypothetical protein